MGRPLTRPAPWGARRKFSRTPRQRPTDRTAHLSTPRARTRARAAHERERAREPPTSMSCPAATYTGRSNRRSRRCHPSLRRRSPRHPPARAAGAGGEEKKKKKKKKKKKI